MSYSWSETITQGVTTIKASHITELHTNINSERAARSLGAYSWTQTPTTGQKHLNVDMTEMRTALDQAHTANVCNTHYTIHYGSHWTSYNVTYAACPTHRSLYNSSYA